MKIAHNKKEVVEMICEKLWDKDPEKAKKVAEEILEGKKDKNNGQRCM